MDINSLIEYGKTYEDFVSIYLGEMIGIKFRKKVDVFYSSREQLRAHKESFVENLIKELRLRNEKIIVNELPDSTINIQMSNYLFNVEPKWQPLNGKMYKRIYLHSEFCGYSRMIDCYEVDSIAEAMCKVNEAYPQWRKDLEEAKERYYEYHKNKKG